MTYIESTAAEDALEPIHRSDPASFKSKLTEMRKPLPAEKIKKRPGGQNRDGSKNNYDYAPWHEVADILDDKAEDWNHSVKDIQTIGDIVTVTVSVTIDGVTREGVGTGPMTETGIKKAEHDGLKRAAVKFGIARGLYQKESDDIDRKAGAYRNEFDLHSPPSNARAQTREQSLSEKQEKMIYRLADELDYESVDEECQERLVCKVRELNKNAASWFISYLQFQKNGAEQAAQSIQQQPRNNVTPINKTGGRAVADAIAAGERLFTSGKVAGNEDGSFEVQDDQLGGPCIVQMEGGVLVCSCGEYKTEAKIKGDVEYLCPHKAAVGEFEKRS